MAIFHLVENIIVDIVPSSPKYLKNVQVSCNKKPRDEERGAESMQGTLYYDVSSLLQFQVADKYGNTIHHLDSEECAGVGISFSGENVQSLYSREWMMRRGTIFLTFLPKLVGKLQMVVRFVYQNNDMTGACTHQIPINIIYPPCSPSLTLKHLDDNLGKRTAGEEFIFEVKPYDMFGNPVLHESEEMCNVTMQASSSKTEQLPVKQIITSRHFAVSVCLKVAGHKRMKLSVNSASSSSSRNVYVEVLPSVPHHLNDVKFTTTGAVDENFSAGSTVMYRNQWSFMEAVLVDCYDNVVWELRNNEYDISLKLSSDGGKMTKLAYEEVECENGKLEAKVKINKPGKQELSITMTPKSSPDEVIGLEDVPVQVQDAPIFLSGSKFNNRNTGVAGKEVRVEIHLVNVFGCPLPADTTTNYTLGCAILKENNKETIELKTIEKEAEIVLCILVVLTKAGSRQVVIFNKDDTSNAKRIHVNVVSSSPKHLRNVKVCYDENPRKEEQGRLEMGTLYYGVSSLLEFHVVDEYGNRIQHLEDESCYDVMIEYADADHSYSCEWEMRSGSIFATFVPKLIGERQVIVRLVDNRFKIRDLSCTHQIPLNIIHPPCSPSITLQFLDVNLGNCIAGEEIYFQLKPYDIFRNHVPNDSNELCDVTIEVRSPKTTTREEGMTVQKTITHEDFTVPVCLKVAGRRTIKVSVNSASSLSSRNVDVEVLPSVPHHLNDVKFTTTGAVDKNFCASSTVMYRNQWSFLEAVLVDCYDNVVQELSNECSISLTLSDDGRNTAELESKKVKFRNGRLKVKMKIDKPGKHKLFITLPRGSNQEQVYPLNDVQVEVEDPPLFLDKTEFAYDKAVAGKEMQMEIHPFNVFGCPLPADTTTDCKLLFSCDILAMDKNKGAMKFERIEKDQNTVIRVSIVLKEAGSRKAVFGQGDQTKSISIDVSPDLSDLHWELVSKKETAHRRENLDLSARLLDRFNNEVRTDTRTDIPKLTMVNGPDGMHQTGMSIEDYKVTFHCKFNEAGNYDFCLEDREGNGLEGTSFSITVQNAPLDYQRSSICWIPEYDSIPDQPVFPKDKSFRSRLRLLDVVGHKYVENIPKDRIQVKYDNTEVRKIKVSCSSKEIGCYHIVVPLTNLVRGDPSPEFWCFVNGRKIEKPLSFPRFEAFETYDDEENCTIHDTTSYGSLKISCYGVTEEDIIGSDFCNLNNIKRICELHDDPEFEEDDYFSNDQSFRPNRDDDDDDDNDYDGDNAYDDDNDDDNGNDDYDYYDDDYDGYYDNDDHDDENDDICTIIKLPLEGIVYETGREWTVINTKDEIENKIQKFRDILLRLLRAIWYRQVAFDLDKDREEWKDMASKYYRKGKQIDKEIAHFCSEIKEKYAALMRSYHDAACNEFFEFFNEKRDQSEIDLHGLLVADDEKLEDYERQLRRRDRLSSAKVDEKIREERNHGDEAIRYCIYLYLRKNLLNCFIIAC